MDATQIQQPSDYNTNNPEPVSLDPLSVPPVQTPRKHKLSFILIPLGLFVFAGIIAGTSYLINSREAVSPTAPQTKPEASEPTPLYAQPTEMPTPNVTPFPTPIPNPDLEANREVIATVGEEQIFQVDLDTELHYYPTKDYQSKQILIDKLIEDSKILQIAKSDDIRIDNAPIVLDASVFNSPTKNYQKRIALISKIKSYYDKNDNYISGTIISVWFANNWIGPLGYEASKQLAYEKITKIHKDVVDKKITIEQAGESLKNDTSLNQIDQSYKTNATFDFSVTSLESITREDAFDTNLKLLPSGGVSAVYLGKADDPNNPNEMIDAYYMFGYIKQKSQQPKVETLDKQLDDAGNTYDVTTN